MKLYYTGVGSRTIPIDVAHQMTHIAHILQEMYTLRSGAASGSDESFELGCTNNNKEIYIPWKGFNHNDSKLYYQSDIAFDIASQYHPNWKNLKDSVKKLHARNVHQVLGLDCSTPSSFLICYTQDGCESHKSRTRNTGGTGQAISIASEHGIEIINMKNLLWKERFEDITGIII